MKRLVAICLLFSAFCLLADAQGFMPNRRKAFQPVVASGTCSLANTNIAAHAEWVDPYTVVVSHKWPAASISGPICKVFPRIYTYAPVPSQIYIELRSASNGGGTLFGTSEIFTGAADDNVYSMAFDFVPPITIAPSTDVYITIRANATCLQSYTSTAGGLSGNSFYGTEQAVWYLKMSVWTVK